MLNLLPSDRKRGNHQPQKHRLKPFISLDVIFRHFLEGKIGHLSLEGKVGQPVQNLLQVTQYGSRTLKAISEQFSPIAPVFDPIPRATAIVDASEQQIPLALYDPKHPILKVLDQLAKHMEQL